MRIAHYAPDLWLKGGVANYVRRLARAQIQHGHEVVFVSRPTNEERAETHPAGTVSVKVTSDRALYRAVVEAEVDILHLHKPVSAPPPGGLATVRTMHDNTAACPSGSRYLSRTGQPCYRVCSVAACLRGHLLDRCGSRRPQKVRANFQRYKSERATLSNIPVMTVSQYVRDEMVRTGYDPSSLFVVASPAPDIEPMTPATGALPRFLFLGRIVPEKGLNWLLRALAQMEISAHADIAGSGRALAESRLLCAELGIEDRVTFHGWVDGSGVRDLLAQARALVVPSLWHEPAGLVTLEAAAARRAVIASRVGGIPEYALPGAALLAMPNDVSGLAAHMSRLARDASLAADMGQTGRDLATERFSMSGFVRAVEAVYQHARERTDCVSQHSRIASLAG